MKANLSPATLTFVVVIATQSAAIAQPTIAASDFQPIIGSWQGSLTYLDYTSNKTVTISANVDIEQIGRSRKFLFSNSFPDEPNVRWVDTLSISDDGLKLNDEAVKSKRAMDDGTIEFVTEVLGIDGNEKKPALLRHTRTIGRNLYVQTKDVQFVGTTEWIRRNECRYQVRARMLSPKQMKSDLAILKATWESVHPGLYRYNTKEQIDSYFKALDNQTNAPMEQRQFFILISQLNIKLRCGHSFVSYYNNKKSLKANLYSSVFLPVLFRVIDGKFVVTHNLTDDKRIALGAEIMSINTVPVRTIIDSLLTVSKADGMNGLNKQLDNITIYPRDVNTNRYCLFDIFFPLFFKPNINKPNYSLAMKSANGRTYRVDCAGISKEERQNRFIQRYGELPKNEKSWYLKPIDTKTILFRLGDFATYNWKFDFNKYLDSIFTSINTSGYKNLIVDIRENEGGADDARDAVLSYLTAKPIGCANPVRRLYRYNAIPDSLLPNLDTWDDGFKKPKSNAEYFKTADGFYESRNPKRDCVEILPKENRFKGKVFLITDATNSSATFIMADAFKRNKLGIIVGEKTGGTQQGINGGEIFFFYLPNSKIEMDLPLIYQAPLTSKPDEGILPDHEVKTTAADIAKMRDPQVEFILKKLIR